MSRLHLIEIHEQTWCPAVIRHGVRDCLFTVWKLFFWKNTLPHLHDLLRHSSIPKVIDLCSGGGGPIPIVLNALIPTYPNLEVVLTDWYPCLDWVDPMGSRASLSYYSSSVDARNVPENLDGCRTLFEAFHHFTPSEAEGILADAVRAHQPIAIFEFQRASLFTSLLSFPLNVAVIIAPILQFWHTPFKWGKLLFTIIPLIPLILVLDGIVSILRTYSTNELAELAHRAGTEKYRWEVRQSEDLGWGIMTCLIGWPADEGGVFLVSHSSEKSTIIEEYRPNK